MTDGETDTWCISIYSSDRISWGALSGSNFHMNRATLSGNTLHMIPSTRRMPHWTERIGSAQAGTTYKWPVTKALKTFDGPGPLVPLSTLNAAKVVLFILQNHFPKPLGRIASYSCVVICKIRFTQVLGALFPHWNCFPQFGDTREMDFSGKSKKNIKDKLWNTF